MALKRWICGSDLHGDLADPHAVSVFLQFCQDFKPHKRIFNGDLFDFRALRRGAHAHDMQHSAGIDIDGAMRFLGEYKPNVFLMGNHDIRPYRMAEEAQTALERDWAKMVCRDLERKLKGLRAETRDYDSRHGFYQLGRLRFVHGYACGVSAARKHASMYGPVVFGHDHSVSRHAYESIDERQAWGGGCLCKLDLGYDDMRPAKLRHEQGFTYGWWDDKTGDFSVQQATKICDRWILPDHFQTVRG